MCVTSTAYTAVPCSISRLTERCHRMSWCSFVIVMLTQSVREHIRYLYYISLSTGAVPPSGGTLLMHGFIYGYETNRQTDRRPECIRSGPAQDIKDPDHMRYLRQARGLLLQESSSACSDSRSHHSGFKGRAPLRHSQPSTGPPVLQPGQG